MTLSSVPNNPYAKLMYYLSCVESVLNELNLGYLTNYNNYASLDSDEKKLVQSLAIIFNPNIFIQNNVFIQIPDDSMLNSIEFVKLNDKGLQYINITNVIEAGEYKCTVTKAMLAKQHWFKQFYYEPFNTIQSLKSRPAITHQTQRTSYTPSTYSSYTPSTHTSSTRTTHTSSTHTTHTTHTSSTHTTHTTITSSTHTTHTTITSSTHTTHTSSDVDKTEEDSDFDCCDDWALFNWKYCNWGCCDCPCSNFGLLGSSCLFLACLIIPIGILVLCIGCCTSQPSIRTIAAYGLSVGFILSMIICFVIVVIIVST